MLLIDGYNLLHATDLFGEGSLAGTLRGSRTALLDFLAARLDPRERKRTTIVFDAAAAPPGLPAELNVEGIRVLFARDYADADAMLEDLIQHARAPKAMLVVSGDRRVQRAARQRGAAWVTSSDWFQELSARRPAAPADSADKPTRAADVGDADYWVEQFSRDPPEPPHGTEPSARQTEPSARPTEPSARSTKPHSESPAPAGPPEPDYPAEAPFPPGYADDLAEELEKPDPGAPDDA